MDRNIIYPGQIPLDTDQLQQNQSAMVALAYLSQAVLGIGTVVDGLACIPTTPASMSVLVGTGSIYSLQNLEATAYGSISADTAHQIVKQGIVKGNTTFACPAPPTSGQSRVYLVQAQYQDADAGSTVLPYYNASDPSIPYSGPGNTGVPQNTTRNGVCVLSLKAGTAAATGTQATPTPDAGYVGLHAITVANGQTTITSGNIAQLATAPFVPTTLPGLPANIQNNAWSYFADTGSANAYAIAPQPSVPVYKAGQKFAFKATAANTGASTLNIGPGAKSITRRDGSDLMPGDIPAGSISEVEYDGVNFQLLSPSPLHPSSGLFFSTGSGTVADGLTRYFGMNGIVSPSESDVTFRMPFAARVSRFYGYSPATTAGSRIYTVRRGGTDTALTCSSSGSNPVGSDLTHYVDFALGEEITIKVSTNGGSDTVIHKASLMIERLG